jgi:3-oxoadipate enol-lactonase
MMPIRTLDGAAFHYEETGTGLPVVLLHGFPLDCRMWSAQRTALSDRFRVITPDLRGFGKSAPPGSFSIDSLADDVHALLKDLGALPCVLGGLSMGGYAVLAYAKKYPADLKGLMLMDTRAEGDTSEGKEARMKMIDLVRQQGPPAVAAAMLPKLLAPKVTTDAAPARPPATGSTVASELRAMMEACPAATIEYALLAMRDRPDRTADLAAIAVPTLIVVGESDAITPPKLSEAMAAAIPDSTLVVIRGAGHMSPVEQPDQANRAIRDFAAKLA